MRGRHTEVRHGEVGQFVLEHVANREVKLKQPHPELRLLLAWRRFHKAQKPADLGSNGGEGAPRHTREQFLVRHSWQPGAPRPSHGLSSMTADRQGPMNAWAGQGFQRGLRGTQRSPC